MCFAARLRSGARRMLKQMSTDDDAPEPAPEKPRFLLPAGCKDLIDALRLQQLGGGELEAREFHLEKKDGEMYLPLPERVRVRDLAAALDLKPYVLIGGLMHIGVFTGLNDMIDFATAAKVCAARGIRAIKAG